MTPSSRLFLAHASEDKPAVRQLYQKLKARGFEPWLDSEDLLPGQIWRVEIPKAIRDAAVFLACLSSRSVAKVGYVQNEFRLALSAFGQRPAGSIYLIPVRLDDCEVPDLQIPDLGLRLRNLHWVDLFADDGLDRLVRALTEGAKIAPASSASPAAPVPLQVFRDIDAPWCPEMVVIPAGRFVMGSAPSEEGRLDHERPQHFVTIAESFALGRYSVTFDEHDEFAATTGQEPAGDEGWGRGRRPVINVSWGDAQAYVAWLSKRTGATYRLPSEAEWEYACRAGTTTPFHFGPTISTDEANYDGNNTYGAGRKGADREQTLPVGSFPANDFGLHDMHGNVWEWCADVWHESYDGAPLDGSAWLEGGDQGRRVLRGGSWNSNPRFLRSATRNWFEPVNCVNRVGFRVARTLR
jgi:formylglycine-generating enzyme required for sulfatase activity